MEGTPKVFISYSWSNPNHQDWVINLAERLLSDGVDVVIDRWNLKEGQDKFNFMESMVKSDDIDRVLIILDKTYSEKAEQRAGGVGTETQIISPKIYANVSQEKFLPIISQKNDVGEPYVPTYLIGRIYIDLSEEEHFEENYEGLLRNIYKRPAISKPQLGKIPGYLLEDSHMTHRTSNILRSFDNQILKNPNRVSPLLRDFLDEFIINLKGYTITSKPEINWGKEIHDNINSYTPLRNDYISFMDKLLKSGVEFDIDIMINFFERLNGFKDPQDDRGGWSQREFDNFRFCIHELFLYTIAVCLKNEAYGILEELFYTSYFFRDRYRSNKEPERFQKLYHYVESFDDYYKAVYSKNFHSPMADFIIKRVPDGFDKDIIVDADLLCYYISELEKLRWFPITYIYRTEGGMELFRKLVSLRYFEKVKGLLGVGNPDELKSKLAAIKAADTNPRSMRYSGSFDSVAPIYELVDIDKIATVR